jgi:hypothetical protein
MPVFSLAIADPFVHIPPAFAGQATLPRAKQASDPTALDDIPALAAAEDTANPTFRKDIRCRSQPIASRH